MRVYEIFIDQVKETIYYVMEYIPYKSLNRYIKKRNKFSGRVYKIKNFSIN